MTPSSPCGLSFSFFEKGEEEAPSEEEAPPCEETLIIGLNYWATRMRWVDEHEAKRVADACARAEKGFAVLRNGGTSAKVNHMIKSLILSHSLPAGLTRKLAPFMPEPPLDQQHQHGLWKQKHVCIYEIFKSLLKSTHELRYANSNTAAVSLEYSRAVDLLAFMEGQREMKETIDAHIAIEAACALVEAKEFFHRHLFGRGGGCVYRTGWSSKPY